MTAILGLRLISYSFLNDYNTANSDHSNSLPGKWSHKNHDLDWVSFCTPRKSQSTGAQTYHKSMRRTRKKTRHAVCTLVRVMPILSDTWHLTSSLWMNASPGHEKHSCRFNHIYMTAGTEVISVTTALARLSLYNIHITSGVNAAFECCSNHCKCHFKKSQHSLRRL